jgi:hypothetical protein
MLEIVNELIDKIFSFENKEYKVTKVSVKFQKAVIETDKRTFVWFAHELSDFIEKITIVEDVKKSEFLPSNEVVSKMTPLKAEIIHTNEQARRITDKLEDVFNELASKPKEETYKKAKAMVDASNAIVNMQLANYKFLSLK